MATTEATLMVASSYTQCSACNEGTDPAAETHATATGYGMQYPADGCGARFTAISSNTTVSRPEVRDAIRGILRAMRPDLPIVDAYDGQGIATDVDPAAAAEVVRSWLVGTDERDLVEFEAPVLRALLAERDQLTAEVAQLRAHGVGEKYKLGHGGAYCAHCRKPMREGTPVVRATAPSCLDCAEANA